MSKVLYEIAKKTQLIDYGDRGMITAIQPTRFNPFEVAICDLEDLTEKKTILTTD
jgi:hypothetical protein